MIQPKAKFQQDKAKTTQWADVVDSSIFQEAALTALAQMTLGAGAPDMATAAAMHYKLEGAKTFLAILMSLPTPPEPPKRQAFGNLKEV